jgi:transmembrane sensor
MHSNNARVQYLFQRYFEKTASQEERTELANLIGDQQNKEQFMQLLTTAWDKYEGKNRDAMPDDISHAMLRNILPVASTVAEAPVRRMLWRRIAAAAAILIIIAGGYGIFFYKSRTPDPVAKKETVVDDARPGTFKARLTLADGSHIALDTARAGNLATQGGTTVINSGGQLLYKQGVDDQPVTYNTLSTNRGETYSLLLPDGSKLWLNSASSVHFPVAFSGKERRIEITGEVYIQVAKDASHPFIASVRGMEVLALGTEFNINAYTDESAISTTLIEGSVKVTQQTANRLLKPGQQTKLVPGGELSVAKAVNTEEVVSWKEGYFHFESADLQTILRQFARWYDVEVVYEGQVKNRKFFAIVKRSSTLKNVLALLHDNEIVYKVDGKKLIVSQ